MAEMMFYLMAGQENGDEMMFQLWKAQKKVAEIIF